MVNFEFEVGGITKASGVSADQADGEILSLLVRSCDRALYIRTGADAMQLQSHNTFRQAIYFGGLGHTAPVIEAKERVGGRSRLIPQALQLLLERIVRGEWLFLRQQLIQLRLVRSFHGLCATELGPAAIADHLDELSKNGSTRNGVGESASTRPDFAYE